MNSPRPAPTIFVAPDSEPGWPKEKYGLTTAITGTLSPNSVLEGSQYERWTLEVGGPVSQISEVSTSKVASWTSKAVCGPSSRTIE